MDCIVNVTEGWAIGNGGALQITIREDMRRFRALTAGKTLVLGRKTLSTFPGGKPLPHRRNLILSRSLDAVEGAECVSSLEELFALLRRCPQEEVMVIGGASVYRALLPWCRRAYVTKTQERLPADAWFPDLDADPNWVVEEAGEERWENGVCYRFFTYRNLCPRAMDR